MRIEQKKDYGMVRRGNFSLSGDVPLPLALKRAEEMKDRSRLGRFLKKLLRNR